MNAACRSASATRKRSIPETPVSCENFPSFVSYTVLTTKKTVLIILDGVGIGELPDAALYDDEGSDTLRNTAFAVGGLRVPNLASFGLGNIMPIEGVARSKSPRASFGKMAELSRGKDSTTGHWELAGVITRKEFPTFPQGFPAALMDAFCQVTGSKSFLGNTTASGTTIIHQLGAEHVKTGFPIVYTSADSVFQIAAHEDVIPLDRLYEICQKTRDEVCVGEFGVGRVIARPFIGSRGKFKRTAHRKDFSLDPAGTTVLDLLQKASVQTTGVGKVDDLFNRRGLASMYHTTNNLEGMEVLLHEADELESGLIVANLGDFDTLYGHRNDPVGFARALAEFDEMLPWVVETLTEGDMLLITADHGNDPVTPTTDHTREYVPILAFTKSKLIGADLGTRTTFADVAKTIAEFFGLSNALPGTSFLAQVSR